MEWDVKQMYNKPTFYTYTFLVQSADKIVVQLKLMMLLSLAHFFCYQYEVIINNQFENIFCSNLWYIWSSAFIMSDCIRRIKNVIHITFPIPALLLFYQYALSLVYWGPILSTRFILWSYLWCFKPTAL